MASEHDPPARVRRALDRLIPFIRRLRPGGAARQGGEHSGVPGRHVPGDGGGDTGARGDDRAGEALTGRSRRLVQVLRKGSEDSRPRLRPTPLGLFGITVAAMFVTLLLIQSLMGTFRTDDADGADGSGGAQATAAPPPSGTARILVVGDSIVQGSSGDYTWRYRLWRHLSHRSDLDVDFVGPETSMLDLATGTGGADSYAEPGFDTDHAGRWGATAAGLARDVGEQVAEYDPHYLLFMAGVNDFVHGGSAEDALGAVRDAVTAARVAKGGVRVVLGEVTPVWGSGSDESMNNRIAEFNASLPSLARDISGDRSPVVVARTAADFAPAQDTWDGTHPDARGELKIAAAFADALAEDLGLGRPYPRPLPDVRTGPRRAPEVEAEDTDDGVRLAWDPVPGATRYQVLQQRLRPERDEQVALPVEVSAPGEGRAAVAVDRLLAGATYEFVVRPFKGDDGGARSDPVRVSHADDPPPAPDRVRIRSDGSRLTWDGVSSATHYEVWRRPLRCALPEPPSESPSAGSGQGTPSPSAPAQEPGGEDSAECEPRDGKGPEDGEGWSSAAVVDEGTRWQIDGGAAGWEFAVRAHRDFVRGGYSGTVSGGSG
ncbi:GDSL-type esterase/lipase family protein [Streptomonospora wellingtoniae]|uniref:GDSL-type esterase/lipase family protein n=1 Tax=Streptomonospora wellingtoniae TaxID=3075544 RepID=A0ABU2KR36_9ACTN|nr:GDSL-type esterase/lipase family protein [Streptomonospora sp. DSM 45055]MDT0301642.1 GDSL-type esterase/lipase family protein [Streptomonospora sp. DSM 45055]